MSTKFRVRAALVMIALGIIGTVSTAAATAPSRGYGNCRDCGCSPYQTGQGNTCARRTCGHSYYRHY